VSAETVISVEAVSKKYRLGMISSGTLHEDLSRGWARLRGKPDPRMKIGGHGSGFDEAGLLWALRDVDLHAERGEVLGVIGRNGAGKSTLLKILSRVTAPSSGQVKLKGRLASLLEVGTGFHPELTGRDNIYLNGAILGMSRREVTRRFDEIVQFAEVEEFVDTPVKRYSSGMYVRLAFAVAAHIDPDILLVDEVLAVGDAAFQRKCIGRMGAVASEGRTVLVVSHNMATIDSLCTRCILIERGSVAGDGQPAAVIRQYLEAADAAVEGEASLVEHEHRLPGMSSYLTRVRLLNADGQVTSTYVQGAQIVVEIAYDASECALPLAGAGIIVTGASGARVGGFNTYMAQAPPHAVPQAGVIRFTIKGPCFAPGAFWVTVSLGTHPRNLVDKVEHALGFSVLPRDIYETGYLLTPEDGVVAFSCEVEYDPAAGLV
jgi:lipopolysaccharide transport system ATP-binding protein